MLLAIPVIMHSSAVSAGTEGDYKAPALPTGGNIADTHPYHIGMSKEGLYKIYPASSQQNYYRQGNEEWIVFDDIMTKDDFTDVIVFYLKDGKVLGWDKKELPKTPEQRLKTLTERRKKFGGADLSLGGRAIDPSQKTRRPIYQPTRVNINDW